MGQLLSRPSPYSIPPDLVAMRRPLKPLLAEVLTGEPWEAAFEAPRSPISDPVIAATIASYASARDAAWHRTDINELPLLLDRLLAQDLDGGEPGRPSWRMAEALRLLLPTRSIGRWSTACSIAIGRSSGRIADNRPRRSRRHGLARIR